MAKGRKKFYKELVGYWYKKSKEYRVEARKLREENEALRKRAKGKMLRTRHRA